MTEQLMETTFPQWEIVENTEEKKGPLRVSGLASITGVPNRNNRIYPTEAMRREVERMNLELNNSNRVGLVDHPMQGESSVSDMGMKFTRLWMEGNTVQFEAEIIPTQRGKDLEAIIKAGINLGISSRAYATVKPITYEGKTYTMVQDDMELISFDAVLDPSVRTAAITQYEESAQEVPTYLHEAIERLLDHVNSVELNADSNGDIMTNKTEDLINRVMEHGDVPENDVVVDETPEPVIVATTEVEETVEETPETVEEEVTAEETPEVVESETVEEIPVVEEVAEVEPQIVERVVESPELVERVTVAEGRVSTLESMVQEDVNLRNALTSLSAAIYDYTTKGQWEVVAEIARCASGVEFLDKYMIGEEFTSLKNRPELIDSVLAPFGAMAQRIERDRVAVEMTKDELYGRRMLNIFLETADSAEAVKDNFELVKTRVVLEATGKRPVPTITGHVNDGKETIELTEEQKNMRRLAYGAR